MKKTTLSLLASLLIFNTAQVQAAEYKLDPGHTRAVFYIDHFNTSTNSGGFYNISGDMVYSPEKETGHIQVTIPVSKLNTGVDGFNQHMLSPDILDAVKYPVMKFESTKWHFAENKLISVDGNLTIKGITQPVQFRTTKFGCYFSPVFKADVCGGDFETKIDRTQWGVDYLADSGIPADMTLKIQAEAVKR